MESLPKWKNIPVSRFCLFFVWLNGVHRNLKQVAGKEVVNEGFISIDCGASVNYRDETTGIWYQTDENFIGSGTNHRLSPDVTFSIYSYVRQQLQTLRSFPEGERNCYTLKPEQQKDQKYLIRAIFAYGNYDNKNQVPVFHLYLGVNFWATVELPGATYFKYYEIIQQVTTDIVQVCLVNTGKGTPFVNTLELRPLNNSIYSTSLPLSMMERTDVGSEHPDSFLRYKDDVYDRLWKIDKVNISFWDPLDTMKEITMEDSAYKVPPEVLGTAVQPNQSSYLYWNCSYNVSDQYHVLLHFAEIQKLPPGHKRMINVTFGDNNFFSQPLEYLKPVTISSKNPTQGYATFTVKATAESDALPILNAFEVYKLIPQLYLPTNKQDVNAIMGIKRAYGLSRINWQGDPCVPSNVAWDGLNCSSDKNPRITSMNLSSSKLTGQIIISFANLKKLESLDLSDNELTGQLPKFLGDLPNLKFLNLTGNKLIGSIPKALREKANLQLSSIY